MGVSPDGGAKHVSCPEGLSAEDVWRLLAGYVYLVAQSEQLLFSDDPLIALAHEQMIHQEKPEGYERWIKESDAQQG